MGLTTFALALFLPLLTSTACLTTLPRLLITVRVIDGRCLVLQCLGYSDIGDGGARGIGHDLFLRVHRERGIFGADDIRDGRPNTRAFPDAKGRIVCEIRSG